MIPRPSFAGLLAAAALGLLACGGSRSAPGPQPRVYDIAPAWTGARVPYSAVRLGRRVFAAYYDADRWMTLAVIDLDTSRVSRLRLPDRFAGWDSHNGVVLAVDPSGVVHVSGDMHARPLVYFQVRPPYGPGDIVTPGMTGRNETAVTAPTFLRNGDGDLFFLYRQGVSGDADWYVDRFADGRWIRANPGPVFASRWRGQSVSAYPSDPVLGPDGAFHVALMWRGTPDVATNFRITYARTRDFRTWTGLNGAPIRTPLDPDQGDVVADPGPNTGLINTQKLSVDAKGRPYISFTRYGPSGANAVMVARGWAGRWSVATVAEGRTRLAIEGKGSLPQSVGVNAVQFTPAGPVDCFRLPGARGHCKRLDEATLAPVESVEQPGTTAPRQLLDTPDGLASPVYVVSAVLRPDLSREPDMFIGLPMQGPNRDAPRACTPSEPRACNPPPKTLRLIVMPGGG